MKRLLFILLICFSTGIIFAQKDKTDQIIKLNGFTIKAKVISTKGDKITYQIPNEDYVVQLKKAELQKIIFHDGRIMEFNKVEKTEETKDKIEPIEEKPEKETPVIEDRLVFKEDIDSLTWANVKVTENPDEVAGLKELGLISGFAEGNIVSTPSDVLMHNAIRDLKKEAVLINAHTVLIKEIKHDRTAGELPKTIIEGIGFGD